MHPLQGLSRWLLRPTMGDMNTIEPELLRPATAAKRYDFCTRTLERLRKDDPAFPEPIRLGRRLVLFKRAELDAYFAAKRASTKPLPCAANPSNRS